VPPPPVPATVGGPGADAPSREASPAVAPPTPVEPASAAGRPPPPPGPAGRRAGRRLVIPAVLILATAAVGLVLLLAKGGSGPSASRTPGGPSRTPSAPHVSATIEVGKDPNGIAFGNGSVW